MPGRRRPPREALDAALAEVERDRQFPSSERDPDAFRDVRAFALVAIADELHEIRWLLWRATRAPGETSPADVEAWRQRAQSRPVPGGGGRDD